MIDIETSDLQKEIVIKVIDRGKGISKDKFALVFDYFYTTKDPGKGVGLGLSVVYNLVIKMNGNFNLETTEGGGLTCIIRIPSIKIPIQ